MLYSVSVKLKNTWHDLIMANFGQNVQAQFTSVDSKKMYKSDVQVTVHHDKFL